MDSMLFPYGYRRHGTRHGCFVLLIWSSGLPLQPGQERLDSHSSPTKAATATAAANANAASDSNYKKKRVRVTVAVATLDLEPYISNYKSRSTRIDRLAFIAERCPVTAD
ncbi:hypothetical protein BASA81_013394 [Batrachochytrium salamandrivorans]|nr:hypothetical protein BASA81_013394 [Batrachochytrium salamandrivorans]